MKRYHVMQIIYSLSVGGLENGVVNIVNNLEKRRYIKNSICCLKAGGELEKRLSNNVEIFKLRKKEGKDWSLLLDLIKLLKKQKPAIVHTRNWAGIDGIFCAKIAGVPIIIHSEHGFEITDLTFKNRKRNLIRKIFFSNLTNKIVTVSQNLKTKLINELNIPKNKVICIPNGVDTKKFNCNDKLNIRNVFGFKENEFILGIVARLDPIKNHKTLLLAFKRLSSNYPQSRLLIVGDGPLREYLEKFSHSLGIRNRVIFLGERNDVPQILKCLDVFVLPSLNEGMSNTILEAMATGIPVIASRVGGNPELVVDGETGFLFSPEDVEDLFKKIKHYISNKDLKYQHGQNARKRVEEKFSLDKMVYQYEKLYLDTLKEKNLLK